VNLQLVQRMKTLKYVKIIPRNFLYQHQCNIAIARKWESKW